MGKRVSTRQVFYFHGYDRRGPRYFNLWQRREARRYSERHGVEISVGPLTGDRWRIHAGDVATEFIFMDWTDIIQKRAKAPFWRGVLSHLLLLLTGLWQGFFGRIRRKDWGLGLLLIWGFLPAALCLIALAVSAFIGWFAVGFVLIFSIAFFWLLKRMDRYLGVFYIGDIAWAARAIARRRNRALEARLNDFVELVKASDADEVLVVGHSVGSALALSAIDRAGVEATLITVGQSIPLVSFQREAGWLNEAMARVKADGRLWVDISAGRDLLGFLAFDPSVGGAKCFSANLRRSMGDAQVRSLRWNGFAMHFLYFQASLRGGVFWDWFAVLTGAETLASRLAEAPVKTGLGDRRILF